VLEHPRRQLGVRGRALQPGRTRARLEVPRVQLLVERLRVPQEARAAREYEGAHMRVIGSGQAHAKALARALERRVQPMAAIDASLRKELAPAVADLEDFARMA
jgi:hypothetical protein